MNNFEMLKVAEKYLGQGGSRFRKFCGLPSGSAWCNAYVDYIFNESGNTSLFCNGRKVTYCPTSMKWCQNNLAQIPIYLAMPCDVIYFDWEPNGVPNHIGLVRERKSDLEVYTIEGNTSGGIVANKTRTEKYVCGCYRPHFKPTDFSADKKLDVDSYFGYNSIAVLQRWLNVTQDAILGRQTILALQKRLGVAQDGSWGTKTSKAMQKMLKSNGCYDGDVDGYFGPASVKALQSYLNKQVFGKTNTETNIPQTSTKTRGDRIADTAVSLIGRVKYKSGGTDIRTGVDCTGFVQHCYKVNGITMGNKLSDWGKSIGTDASKAKRGDIFTYKSKTGIHHAIYVGDGKVVHAANKKDGVKMSKWNAMSRPLVGIRRRWK